MARLFGRDPVGSKWIEFGPVFQGSEASEYRVAIGSGEEVQVQKSFSIHNWLMGPDPIWAMACTFAQSDRLIGRVVPFEIWRHGGTEPVAIYHDLTTIKLAIWGAPKQKQIGVEVFVEEGTRKVYRSEFVNAPLAAAQQFGVDLKAEIVSASPTWWADRNAT